LVCVLRGRILDVAVDIRAGSPTYGRHVSAELGAEDGRQLFVPVGFAHGFCTLENDVEVMYKVSDYYAPALDGGIRWDDADIRFPWPFAQATSSCPRRTAACPRSRISRAHLFMTAIRWRRWMLDNREGLP
jgi:dTDP-4-dehydrorhamnose 3,5-epimerase